MPRLPRFFISPDQAAGETITVSGEDVRHIGAVLRMQAGDELVLCDGAGTDYRVRISSRDRDRIVTSVLERSRHEPSRMTITLGQALPKADKMDFIVQKATELGVAAIIPLITERTIMKIRDEEKRSARWRKICREAAMQSNRPDIPVIGPVKTYAEFVQGAQTGIGTLLLLPWEEGTEPIREVLRSSSSVGEIIVLIGPEGGISEREADLACQHGFRPVSLGRNILRAETAALAVLAMIQYEFPD